MVQYVMFHWVIPICAVYLAGEIWFKVKRHQLQDLRMLCLRELRDEAERIGLRDNAPHA